MDGVEPAERLDEAVIVDDYRRGMDAASVTREDAGAGNVYSGVVTDNTNNGTCDGAGNVERCSRTEPYTGIVSRHRRAGSDVVGIIVVVKGAVADAGCLDRY